MADALGTISDQLGGGGGAVAVDGLGPAALGRVGGVLGGGQSEDVGPLLELFLVCLGMSVFPSLLHFEYILYLSQVLGQGQVMGTYSWDSGGCCRRFRGSCDHGGEHFVTTVHREQKKKKNIHLHSGSSPVVSGIIRAD